ncbi:MAG: hypothetical protein LBC20_03315 [Planctomycetaceae bacterium]|nr:hypothetical protein [Planctomycetaceae bacterium]
MIYAHCDIFNKYSEPPLSPQAQQVITLFKQLKPAEQSEVMQELQKIMGATKSESHASGTANPNQR